VFSFNPPTISGSGVTDLIITPGVNSGTGIFTVLVTASNGSQSVTTMVTLNVVARSPAVMLTPANGGMLTGGTLTKFTWSAGFGVTQYQLSIGTTPGASDVASVSTNAPLSQIEDLPCGISGSQIFVTLISSFFDGSSASEGYGYPWCDCGVLPPLPVPSSVLPTIVLVSSEPNVLNNGQSQVGTYELYDQITGRPLASSSIDPGSLLVCGQTCGQVSAQVSNTNGSLFDVTFVASPGAPPGQQTLNLSWNSYGISLSDAVQVDDGTPTINGIWPSAIPPGQSSVLISLYGTNFGPTPGSIAICAAPVDPCTSSVIQVATLNGSPNIPYWSDNQVNLFVNTTSTPPATYYVQLTSGGESPGLGFVSAPGGQSSAESNFAPLQVATITSGFPTTISYNGSTIASSYSGPSCASPNCSVSFR